jgi:hypothetical protein
MTKSTTLLALAIGAMLTTGTAAMAAARGGGTNGGTGGGQEYRNWPSKYCIDGIGHSYIDRNGRRVPCL